MEKQELYVGPMKRLYGEKVQALRWRFRRNYNGSANDAHCVMDFLARLASFDDSNHYTALNNALIGDVADSLYVHEEFVRCVLRYCVEIGIFDTKDDSTVLQLKDYTVLSSFQ